MSSLPTNTQENVLAVLCFGSSAQIVSGIIKPSLFDNEVYRTVAEKSIKYIQRYRKAPGTHIVDLLYDQLQHKNKARAESYREVIANLYQAKKERFNEDYIISSLREFIREQRLKNGILKSAKLLQTGNREEAERVISEAMKTSDEVFDAGITLEHSRDVLRSIADLSTDTFPTGIPFFDKLGIKPARKTLFMLMAPTNRGKTWGLIHLGKHAALLRHKVLHVTLEMSEKRILARYLQTLFSMQKQGKLNRKIDFTVLKSDDSAGYLGYKIRRRLRPSLTTRRGKKVLRQKLKSQRWGQRLKLIVKEFPTSTLSTAGLESYLDYLERFRNFIPDVIIIDYPDLMEINPQYLRIDTGRIYKELRGVAIKRNCAVITATQSNRSAEGVEKITYKHVSEDYSKATTADVVITYNQTELEKRLNLARLLVLKSRDERVGDTVLISQAYDVGQFHIDSLHLKNYREYFGSLGE